MPQHPSRPRIAFCITCKGRAPHVKITLPQNLTDNRAYEAATFYLLDYGSPDDLTDYLKAAHQRDIDSGRLVVYAYPAAEAFRMAHAKNMAHRTAIREGADILVNLDADNFTGPDFAGYIAAQLGNGNGENAFLWANMIKTGENRLPRGISGRIVVSASAFLKSGGYDEKYNTWAPDDKDFNLRLRRLGYTGLEIDRLYLGAILHNDKMRFREYKHAEVDMGEEQFDLGGSTTTVVNAGHVGEGTVYRNFDMTAPIALGPLPTRIFGIGMHKTATTSLHHALSILGFDSAHWRSAHWAKAIWDEMRAEGRSHTLEHHYALMDLPIPLLYRELDKAYPGSKFILTTRNESSWLDSVRNHWSHEHNPFRHTWDTDPFTHIIHRALYGRKKFDADVFLERFRRHNRDVLEYFQDRPSDLLVMDMDSAPGWWPLCEFLGKPVPQKPYPTAMATRKHARQIEQIKQIEHAEVKRGTIAVYMNGNTPRPARVGNQWQDEETHSTLVLQFGHIDARIELLSKTPERWGVRTNPFAATVVDGDREQAKEWAELWLRTLLDNAIAALPRSTP